MSKIRPVWPARAAQAACWPRRAEAPGSLRRDLALQGSRDLALQGSLLGSQLREFRATSFSTWSFDDATLPDGGGEVVAVRPLLTTPVEQVEVCALHFERGRRLASLHNRDREACTCEVRCRSKAGRPATDNHNVHGACRSGCNGACSTDGERVRGSEEQSRHEKARGHEHGESKLWVGCGGGENFKY